MKRCLVPIVFGALALSTACVEPCDALKDLPTGGLLGGSVSLAGPLQEDGRGTLMVTVFAEDPLANNDACCIHSLMYHDVDYSQPAERFIYEVAEIPERPEAYWVMAVFDDDGTFTEDFNFDDYAPMDGDLFSIHDGETPVIEISDDTPRELDLELTHLWGS